MNALTRKRREANARHRATPSYARKHRLYARAWRAKNKLKVYLANQKQYYKSRDKNLRYSREYYAAHKEQCLAYQKRYRKKNAERLLAQKADYYVRKRTTITRKKRIWGQKNPHLITAASQKRAARKRGLTPKTANQRAIKIIYEMSRRVGNCLGIPFHVDHVKSLNSLGPHHEKNLQILPAVLNIRKFTRCLPRWADKPEAYARRAP